MDNPHPGAVYWVTGLAGAGKSTLAAALAAELRRAGRPVVRLDGDRIRPIVGLRLGFGQADRRAMSMIYAKLCREFAFQGLDVVCATVSMHRGPRDWARAEIPRYREVYIRGDPEMLAARHPRGLIAAARAGRLRNVPGVDLAIEQPEGAEVVIEDDGTRPASAIAAEAMSRLWPGGEHG